MTKLPLWHFCKLSLFSLQACTLPGCTESIDQVKFPLFFRSERAEEGRECRRPRAGRPLRRLRRPRSAVPLPASQRRSGEWRPGAPLLEAMAVRSGPCLLAVAFVAAAWVSGASSVPEQVRRGGLDFAWARTICTMTRRFVVVVAYMRR
jgi:hypothetical protein